MLRLKATMIEELWFSTPIWYEDNFLSNEEFKLLKNFCCDVKDKDSVGRLVSNVGGWQSNSVYENTFKLFNCGFYPAKVENQSRLIFKRLSTHPEFINNSKFNIVSWINVNKKDNYNAPHAHALCELSCVYYLTSGSKIVFQRPTGDMTFYLNNIVLSTGETNISTYCVEFQPRPNLIIFFPSFLMHNVLPLEEDYDRISVASNIKILK
jgi:uncharacterized protein (TIGR02466 family)